MSALTCYEGLEERFRTVRGLKNIILGEPTAAHELPCLYTAIDRFEHTMKNQPPADNLSSFTYYFTHRLVIRWQENARAEQELLTLLDAIPLAIDADPGLGRRLGKGTAAIGEGIAGFQTISGTRYRVVDYTSKVVQKKARNP